MKNILTLLSLLFTLFSIAQDAPEKAVKKQPIESVTLGGYIDTYYAYYPGQEAGKRVLHNCIGAYNQTFSVNVAQLSAAVSGDKIRSKMTLQYGDIPSITYNRYSAIQEANAGVRFAENWWFDMGVFKTHIGAESFLPKDNMLSQIALATYYGPFFHTGARFTFQKNDWEFQTNIVTGYNRVLDDNAYPSLGFLVSKSFGKKLKLSYSNLIGEEETSLTSAQLMFYNNIYADMDLGKIQVLLNADVATQKYANNVTPTNSNNLLVGTYGIVKAMISKNWSVAGRAEWFFDPSSINSLNYVELPESGTMLSYGNPPNYVTYIFPAEVNSGVETAEGLNIAGFTVSAEYAPNDFAFIRLESRYLHQFNQNPILPVTSTTVLSRSGFAGYDADRIGVMLTLGIHFDKNFTFAE